MVRLFRRFQSVAVILFGMTAIAEPRCLIFDEDNDHYFKCSASWMDEAHLNAYIDRLAAGGKVTHIFLCPTGGRASFDSKTWEPIWKGLSEQPREEIYLLFRRWSENAKSLHDKGIDPYRVWIRRCRERGISPWLSPRMNDAHDGAAYGQRRPYRATTFWRTRKDLRCYPDYEKGSWRHHQLDYSKREVRENALEMIAELFERYDFDGLNLHANRWFPDETARANISVMTEFVRQVRKMADRWEKCRGHRIGLSVCRAGFTPEACRERGFDAAAMAREGLLDIIVCQPDTNPNFNEILDVDGWRRELADARALIVAGRAERFCQTKDGGQGDVEMSFTAEMFRGWADQQAMAGADGFYLFNVEYLPDEQLEICKGGLFPRDIRNRSRVYLCAEKCLPEKLDATNGFTFVVGEVSAQVASVVVGFSNPISGLPAATLNGCPAVRDEEVHVIRENFDETRIGEERYVAIDCPGRRLVFPASAIRPGSNAFFPGNVNSSRLRYLELRVDPDTSLSQKAATTIIPAKN